MRKLIKIFLFSLLIAAQLAHSRTAFLPVPIYHFNSETNHWQRYSINQISSINRIITAGQYAWAANYNTAEVAFFDGQHWSPGTKIIGMKKIINEIDPAYPLSGEKPFAWVAGKDIDGNTVVAYFDGRTWSPAQLIKPGYIDFRMNVSAGHAWIGYNDGARQVFKVADSEHPLEWKEVYSHPHYIEDTRIYSNALSFDDKMPALVIQKVESDNLTNANVEIIRVNPKGETTVLQKLSSIIPYYFLINDNYIIHDYFQPHDDYYDTIYLISNDRGNHWIESKVENAEGIIFQYNFYQGIICFDDYHHSYINHYCANTTTENKWKKFTLPSEELEDIYQTYTNSAGSWLVSPKTKKFNTTKIFYFNVNSGQLTDLQIENVADRLGFISPFAHAVGENELITCGIDKQGNVAGFYYDGSKWASERLDLPHDCQISFAGGTHPLFTTKDKNVWVY